MNGFQSIPRSKHDDAPLETRCRRCGRRMYLPEKGGRPLCPKCVSGEGEDDDE